VSLSLLTGCTTDFPPSSDNIPHGKGGINELQNGGYLAMLQGVVTAHWDQPLSLIQSGKSFSAVVLIKIDRSGRITKVSLSKSSGNSTMDESVMNAAQSVTQVDPVPNGFGDANGFEVNIEFKLIP